MALIKLDKPYSFFSREIMLQSRHPCSPRIISKFINFADLDSKARCRQSNSLLQLCRTRSADRVTLSFRIQMEKENSDSAPPQYYEG